MAEEKKLTGFPSIDKPWLKYYSEEAINAPVPECTIYEYLMENNRDFPDDIAILYLGRKIKYGELFRQIDRTAAAFSALGVKPGEIVTVALPSIPEALYVVYALNKLGAVANMIHPLAGEREIVNYLNEVASRVAVLYEGSYKIVKNSLRETTVETTVVVSAGESLPFGLRMIFFLKNPRIKLPKEKGLMSWPDFIRSRVRTALPTYKKDPNTLALISHTGGTTGEPKGVMCSDMSCNALMWQLLCAFKFERQEISLNVLPPFVNYSLLESIMAMLAVGFIVVLLPKYEPNKFADYIKKYRPNQILSIPSYWEALLKIENIEKVDMSCFKHLYAGGEKMEPDVENELNNLLKRCGAKTQLYNCMGSTEMMAGATILYDSCYVPGSVGIPMVKVECKIVRPESEEEQTYNCEGEICFSGITLMMGYYNNQEETDAVVKVHADGERWLHTGDLGFMDENGVLYVTGRIKRILMTKGRDGNITKIFPDRIERIISKHGDVTLCCAIGIPDDERINYPVVFVVLKSSTRNKEQISEEILALCRKELPDYMLPEKIVYRDDLPRTPRGKVDYRVMEKIAKEK